MTGSAIWWVVGVIILLLGAAGLWQGWRFCTLAQQHHQLRVAALLLWRDLRVLELEYEHLHRDDDPTQREESLRAKLRGRLESARADLGVPEDA